MKTLFFPVCLLGCSVAFAVACGDDADEAPHTNGPDSGAGGQGGAGGEGGSGGTVDPHEIPDSGNTQCAEIGSLCHAFDDGTGLGAECHGTGHAGDEAACAAIYDECIAFCQTDAGHHEADGGDGGDAGHPAETACEQIGHLCHDLDDGGAGLAHECHEVGHAGDEAACLAMQTQCLAFCAPSLVGDAGAALCEEIGHICHDLDDGGPSQAHECHEVGHAGDVMACAAIYDDCVAHCSGDGGH